MNKQKFLEVLKTELEQAVIQYHLNEVAYRTFSSLSMSSPKDVKMADQQNNSYQMKKALETKIRAIRELSKEVENGTFTV